MATKKKPENDFKDELKANASKVWLAGLGALATAEEEGGKLFRGLVKKGESYEKKGLAQFDRLKSKVEDAAAIAKERAGEAWEKVEEKVGEKVEEVEESWDERVVGALRKIGIPSKNEIANLTRRVEELTSLVGKKLRPAAASGTSGTSGTSGKTAKSAKGTKTSKPAKPAAKAKGRTKAANKSAKSTAGRRTR
ncbi:MAG: phasin family protein [Thermoanaerobaculia bacterium]